MMMVQYLLDTDAEVIIPGVEAPRSDVRRRRRPGRARARPGEAGHRADQRPAPDRPRGVRLRLRAVHAVVHQGAGRGGRHDERPAGRCGATSTTSRTSRSTSPASRTARPRPTDPMAAADRRRLSSPGARHAARVTAGSSHGTRDRGRSGGGRALLRGPAARGRPPGRRARPRPAAGDDQRSRPPAAGPVPAFPQDRVTAWSGASYAEFVGLAGEPDTGVRMLTGTEVLAERTPDPWWRSAVPSLDRETALPAGYRDGWTFVTPVVEMPVYLRWLAGRVEALGGTITRMNLPALPGAAWSSTARARRPADGRGPLGGAGARQVLYVEQVGLERWWLDAAGPDVRRAALARHRGRGHRRRGRLEPHPVPGDGAGDPGPGHPAGARARGRAGAAANGSGCGPVRPPYGWSGGSVVHCYGHGGAGVTLSWGTADEGGGGGGGVVGPGRVRVSGCRPPRRC